MKIAVVSCWFTNNYGSVLQAYATQRYFDEKGMHCDTVSAKSLRPYLIKQKKRYYLKNIHRLSLLASKYPQAKLAIIRKLIASERKAFTNRVAKMNNFRNRFSFVGENAKTLAEMTEVVKEYDIAVLGGDQLLRPDNILPSYYTLEWVPDKVKKVSLATSFGVSELDNASKKHAKLFLPRFSHLSVRENTGCDIIKEVTGQTAVQVCDPVFLLKTENWADLADDSYCPKSDYIFAYFLGTQKWHREYLKKLSKETGLPIVNIPCLDSYLPIDKKMDFNCADASPEQFLGLIKNAKYVCTDSFHVTAFSAMFHRDFLVFKRHSGKKYATNSRIDSFLQTLSLQGRCIESIDSELPESIDYTGTDDKLNGLILKTEEYINSWF